MGRSRLLGTSWTHRYVVAAAVLTCTVTLCISQATPAWAVPAGSVRAWGDNAYGELGNGQAVTNSDKPVNVKSLRGVTAIAAGGSHGLALLHNGTVKAWGDNASGQLGDGSTISEDKPVAVTGLAGVTAVAAGGSFSMALLSNGTVMSWGDDTYGQLGNGTQGIISTTPVPVTGLSGVSAISAGLNNGMALLSDGVVMSWGDNTYGQLGNATEGGISATPVTVSGLSGVTAISAGTSFATALVAGGVMAWGDNASGQLGDGTTSNSDVPQEVTGLSGITAIAAGSSFSLAAGAGDVWAWGDNFYGELGDGSNSNSDTPVAVSGVTTATSIAAGGSHALAVLSIGSVVAWGDNFYGELGTKDTSTSSDLPVAVPLNRFATAVSAGDPGENQGFSMALFSNRTVKAWGYDAYGQLGSGNVPTEVVHPVNVRQLSGVTAIASGGSFSLALLANQTVAAWGDNGVGQLGNGTTGNDSDKPVVVSGLSGVTAIAAGFEHGMALLSNGTVMSWGDNSSGELGNGTTSDSDVPVAVTGLSDVTAIAAGGDFSLALLSDNTVMAWGDNSFGELGDGTTTDSDVPMAVSGLTGVTAISAGLEHALALLDDGSVVSWGNDNSGQLGDGIEGTSSDAPVSVTGLSESVSAVSAGLDHSLALLADGTVVAWGDDGSGELGNGSHTSTDSPVPVSNLTNVTSISAGSNFSLALSAGLVYTWGLDGTTLNNVPVEEKRVRGYIAAISAGGDHSLALTGQRPAMATARPVGGRLGMKAVLQGIRVPPTHAQRGLSHRSATVDRRTRFR